jgi:SAM-dependent methyltransferase
VDWIDILQCPETGNSLQLDEAASLVRVKCSDVTYPLIDGVIDFCPKTHTKISASYDKVASRYDPYITASSLVMKVLSWIVWGSADDRDLMAEVSSNLPNSFDGVLLDVPAGTGVFTADLYSRWPKATIVAVDCSMGMLRKAQARFQEHGLSNVRLLKADAANLPVRDAAVDIVLSMNGWHAFADKQGTTAQIQRVLRQDGTLIACGYVKGAHRRSDWFVRHFGVRNGFFTPPFFRADELARQYDGFRFTRQGSNKSIAWFEAVSKGENVGASP